jgi:SAM-dependent methyltransferase
MLTVDLRRLKVPAGGRVLDAGCGQGRHAFALCRGGSNVVALDSNGNDLTEVETMFAAMRQAGEVPEGTWARTLRGDVRALPFSDGAFDAVILAEVLEHISEDTQVIAEVARILRPGGVLAVTVPRWWPERVCWALSDAYHQVDGGHVRIYRRGRLLTRLRAAALIPVGHHHAHALHSPYWWLRCLFGPDSGEATLPRLVHRLLVYDIIRRPWWTRALDRVLNPVLGKSLVVYLTKPERTA